MSSSITWSLGRYNNVSLVSHCAIPTSSSSQQSSSSSSRRRLSCDCALPAFSISATPTVSESPSKGLHSLSESVHEAPSTSIIVHDEHEQRSGLLRSLVSVVVALAMTIGVQGAPSSRETFEDVPQTLSGEDKGQRIQKPKSAKAETCTRKCVSTCIRGGAGAPGEGPLNVRRPLVVFKEGFRSRNYCLVECSEICNLIGDGDDGP